MNVSPRQRFKISRLVAAVQDRKLLDLQSRVLRDWNPYDSSVGLFLESFVMSLLLGACSFDDGSFIAGS